MVVLANPYAWMRQYIADCAAGGDYHNSPHICTQLQLQVFLKCQALGACWHIRQTLSEPA